MTCDIGPPAGERPPASPLTPVSPALVRGGDMDAYKLLLWTTDPLLVLAVGVAFGALIGFGATFALLLGTHSRTAQAHREAAFLEREGRA